jgi:hypothetical protein
MKPSSVVRVAIRNAGLKPRRSLVKWLSLILSGIVLLVSLSILLGCETMMGSGATEPVAVDSFCAVAKPISWVVEDTDETIRQVKAHNAVWKKLCQTANTP